MRPQLWGALQGAEAGRRAQYLLEVALPPEIRSVAGEEGAAEKRGERTEKRIAFGGRGRGKGKGGKKEGGEGKGRDSQESPLLLPRILLLNTT